MYLKDLEIFPSFVQLCGFCIESSSLLNDSELVADENLCIRQSNEKFYDLKLRKILSDYRTRHLYSICQNNLGDYRQLTEKYGIERIDLNDFAEHMDTNVNENKEFCFNASEEGRLDAFLYCYELLNKNSSTRYSPLDFFKAKQKHFVQNLAAISFFENNGERVKLDDNIRIRFTSKKGFFNMTLNKI